MTAPGGPCISNIAWPAQADEEAIATARRLGFRAIEIAPTKVFGPWDEISVPAVQAYCRRLAGNGLAVPAFQAILSGVPGAKLFGEAAARSALAKHLVSVAQLAGAVGVRALVFGAPKTRCPGDLPYDEAFRQAADFFRSLAPALAAEGVCLCIEANTVDWGCRFITTTRQAIDLVRAIDAPAIRLQLDTGTMITNAEPNDLIAEAADLAGHFHVSEPRLAALGTRRVAHEGIGLAVKSSRYDGWISVEMLAAETWRENLVRAAATLSDCYLQHRLHSSEAGR